MRFLRDSHGIDLSAGPVLNKALEVSLHREKDGGFDLYWRFRTRGDHAGLLFFVTVFGWTFEFNIYDHRHWDYETNTWQVYDDEETE